VDIVVDVDAVANNAVHIYIADAAEFVDVVVDVVANIVVADVVAADFMLLHMLHMLQIVPILH
jgi:hypothetical protein